MADRITARLDTSLCLPAGGQGAVGIECRIDDADILELLKPLHHDPTACCVLAERAVNKRLQGGCQVPIACYAECNAETQLLNLRGLVGTVDGQTVLEASTEGSISDAQQLGESLADKLLSMGAAEILNKVLGAD